MYGEDVWCEHAFCRGGVSVDLIRDGHVVGSLTLVLPVVCMLIEESRQTRQEKEKN